MDRDPFARAGWWGWGILLVIAIAVPAACQTVQAQADRDGVQLSPEGCKGLGDVVRSAALARQVGIRHAQWATYVAKRQEEAGAPEVLRRIVLREIRRVYTSVQTPDQHEQDVYARCMSGPLGGMEA